MNEIKLLLLPPEKPNKTIGCPVISFGNIVDGILYVLRTIDVNGRCCQKKEYGSGSICHRRFQEWTVSNVFRKLWIRLLEVYDDPKGIRWKWQSLDSISIKAPLGGYDWFKPYRQK